MLDGLPEWTTLELWIVKISAALAVLTAIYASFKKIYKWIKEIIETSNRIKKLLQLLEPNGGSSLADAINRIESKLIRSEQREKAILQETPIPMFEANEHGYCIWINKSYQNLTGCGIEEVSGNGWQTCIAEFDRKRVTDEWDECISHQRDFDLMYTMRNCRDAREFKVSCRAYIQRNKSGNPIGWFGIIKKMSGPFET